jgi:diguanylate cyclase (GGDEF)-like protein
MTVTEHDREPERLQDALDEEFRRVEVGIYLTTAGVAEHASALERRAAQANLVSRVRRAQLLRSDAIGRRGALEEALRTQMALLTEAELDADRMICARAQALLAATYDRLAEAGKALLAAEEAVKLLVPADPPHWHAEHMMTLAVCTSYWRGGAVDYTTFDEALRLAREADEPALLLATLNNYAYISLGDPALRGAAVAMVQEMRRLIDERLGGRCPSSWLDTIAVGLLEAGDLDAAAELSERAVAAAPVDLVEPSARALCILTQARIERARGNRDRARERALAAAALARESGVSEAIALTLDELAELAALDGDYELAYRRLRERNELVDRHRSERNELHAVTLQAIYAVEVERQQRLALEALADTDPLTGLYNRRYMARRLAELAGEPLTLALVDLDHFKSVNDRFGHEAGDAVLEEFAGILRAHVRQIGGEGSFVARIGGEEFLVVLPGFDAEPAAGCCEQLRAKVADWEWPLVGRELTLTVSVGLAVQRGDVRCEPSALLSRADAKLYDAKRAGRNRVAVERPD